MTEPKKEKDQKITGQLTDFLIATCEEIIAATTPHQKNEIYKSFKAFVADSSFNSFTGVLEGKIKQPEKKLIIPGGVH